jgi:hypothetical protein
MLDWLSINNVLDSEVSNGTDKDRIIHDQDGLHSLAGLSWSKCLDERSCSGGVAAQRENESSKSRIFIAMSSFESKVSPGPQNPSLTF